MLCTDHPKITLRIGRLDERLFVSPIIFYSPLRLLSKRFNTYPSASSCLGPRVWLERYTIFYENRCRRKDFKFSFILFTAIATDFTKRSRSLYNLSLATSFGYFASFHFSILMIRTDGCYSQMLVLSILFGITQVIVVNGKPLDVYGSLTFD